MIKDQLFELIQSFNYSSKNKKLAYKNFLGYVYMTFDKKISLCRSDREMNKYKKMRNNVLSYIVANEQAITTEICK